MKQFTEKDLVDFGNQLLSKDREVLHEINLHQVTDADLDAFKEGFIGIVDVTDESKLKFQFEFFPNNLHVKVEDDIWKKGIRQAESICLTYAKLGIMPRVGEEIIPNDFDHPITIKNICYCDFKVMIEFDILF